MRLDSNLSSSLAFREFKNEVGSLDFLPGVTGSDSTDTFSHYFRALTTAGAGDTPPAPLPLWPDSPARPEGTRRPGGQRTVTDGEVCVTRGQLPRSVMWAAAGRDRRQDVRTVRWPPIPVEASARVYAVGAAPGPLPVGEPVVPALHLCDPSGRMLFPFSLSERDKSGFLLIPYLGKWV